MHKNKRIRAHYLSSSGGGPVAAAQPTGKPLRRRWVISILLLAAAVFFAAFRGLLCGRAAHAVGPQGHTSSAVTATAVHPIGPPLTNLRQKIADPRWLVAWLLRPWSLRPWSLMRNFSIRAEEAQILSAYLVSGPPPTSRGVNWQGGDRRIGEELFTTRGCRGCHTIGSSERPPLALAPDLTGIGIKVRGDWLFEWLKSPRAYDPNTAMPKLALSVAEIRHLVAFLLSHREGADVLATSARPAARFDPETARTVVTRFDCAKCHLIRGFQTAEPAAGWAVAPRTCASCHEPSSPPPQLRRPRPVSPRGDRAAAVRLDGRRLVSFYNCRGCHRIEGSGGVIGKHLERKTFAPPTLEGEGRRVQVSWLIDFLQHPTNLRPWLQMRMPDYGLSEAEAVALAEYFAALESVPATDEPHGTLRTAGTALGRRRFEHYKCVQCHPANLEGELPPGVDLEDISINLMLAKKRLRPSWIRAFLARPKTLLGTETRMPAVFYTIDGVPKVEHPQRDIAALTAYLLQMTELPAHPARAAATGSEDGDAADQIDWTKYPY